MACRNLSVVALEHIDNQLLIEGLSRLRVELATHPAPDATSGSRC